jgi:pSer/pThr/pTyr-binding forkhead associated (FHA) protein
LYEILSLITKYVLAIVIYMFIFRVVRLIYLDIKSITAGENAVALLPHLKLLTPVIGKNGEAVAELYPLVRPVTLIGRSSKCSIVLPDPYISSEHARIENQKERYFIEDLKSANGTLLNNNKLEVRTELKHGDRISFGGMVLLFSEGGR